MWRYVAHVKTRDRAVDPAALLELDRKRAAGLVAEQVRDEVERLRQAIRRLVVDDPAELELTNVAQLLMAARSARKLAARRTR